MRPDYEKYPNKRNNCLIHIEICNKTDKFQFIQQAN